jgi:hypothetical protein
MAGDRTRRGLAQLPLDGEPRLSNPTLESNEGKEAPANASTSPRANLDDRMQRWFVERDQFEQTRKRLPPESR